MNHFLNNIIVRPAPNNTSVIVIYDYPEDVPRAVARSDYNVFDLAGAELHNTASVYGAIKVPESSPRPNKDPLSLEEWQRLGYDHHSIVADPMFEDPANGNFKLKPGSPALKLGFRQIDTSKIGIRPIRND